MSAVWTRNEVVAAKRRCTLMPVSWLDGSKAPRGTDFTGDVYIARGNAAPSGPLAARSDYVTASGSLTNRRRPLVVEDTTFTADHTTETFTAVAHGLETGDGPIQLTTTTTLPAGLSLATDYWIIATGDDTYQYAASLADAYAGTAVPITDNGTGTHTYSDTSVTQRGLDGQFVYEATQAETDAACSEFEVAILGHATYEAYTTVDARGDDNWSGALEGAITRDDGLRLLVRGETAKYSVDGSGNYVHRDIADTKDSHSGQVTASGRVSASIDDPT